MNRIQRKKLQYPPMFIASAIWFLFIMAIGLSLLQAMAESIEGFYSARYFLLVHQIWTGMSLLEIIYACYDVVQKKKISCITLTFTVFNMLFVLISISMLGLLGSL